MALFLIGAAGDQAPYLTAVRTTVDDAGTPRHTDTQESGHVLAELLGERLADEAVRVGANIRTAAPTAPLQVIHDSVRVPAQVPPAGLHTLRPSTHYDFVPDGTTDAPFVVARIGETVLVGVQAELDAGTGKALKAASPFPATCVVTMVEGAAKYMAAADSYDRITYGAMNSRYGKDSAESVTARILDVLRSLPRESAGHHLLTRKQVPSGSWISGTPK